MDSKSSFKLMIGKSDFSNKKIFGDKPKKVFDYYLMSFKSFYGYSKYFCPENRINFNFILRKANISKILNLFINLLILLILSPTLLSQSAPSITLTIRKTSGFENILYYYYVGMPKNIFYDSRNVVSDTARVKTLLSRYLQFNCPSTSCKIKLRWGKKLNFENETDVTQSSNNTSQNDQQETIPDSIVADDMFKDMGYIISIDFS